MNERNSALSPLPAPEDGQEARLRPDRLEHFAGQEHMKDNLRVFIKAAAARQEAMDHVVLHGPPGLGKTTVAHIVAAELGVGFRATAAPLLTKAGDLAAILTNLQPRDVLFIDEIHRLGAHVEEVLYSAMEDFSLDLIIGEGPAARTVRIPLPPFTLIGATTRMGLISGPLRDRFGIPLRLSFYTPEELARVLERAAAIMGTRMEEGVALGVAKRSRGTPRIALRLLRRIRDFADCEGATSVGAALADYALTRLDVDAVGLDKGDYRYLRFIAEKYDGGPVGVETIAAGLAEQRDSIEETLEPYLLQQGFVKRTPRGRVLTRLAFAHLNLPLPESASGNGDLFGNTSA
ncbi:MAG: Holliday junction branch migration DNA helicase RuvB [Rickettsiales bacterium]